MLKRQIKAAESFAKKCYRLFKEDCPVLAGAFMLEDKQYISNQHLLVRIDTPINGLPVASDKKRKFKYLDHLFKYDDSLPVSLPSLAELKFIKTIGREHTIIRGVKYNIDYLKRLIQIVEPYQAYFSKKGKLPVLVVIGNGVYGALAPYKDRE